MLWLATQAWDIFKTTYFPKWRWIVVDIYLALKQYNIHCYSPRLRWISVLLYTKPYSELASDKKEFSLVKNQLEGDYSCMRPLCFANQYSYPMDIQLEQAIANQSAWKWKFALVWYVLVATGYLLFCKQNGMRVSITTFFQPSFDQMKLLFFPWLFTALHAKTIIEPRCSFKIVSEYCYRNMSVQFFTLVSINMINYIVSSLIYFSLLYFKVLYCVVLTM